MIKSCRHIALALAGANCYPDIMNENVIHELLLENFRKMHAELGELKQVNTQVLGEMRALRMHLEAQQRDINNLYERDLAAAAQLERIERRLDLHDPTH